MMWSLRLFFCVSCIPCIAQASRMHGAYSRSANMRYITYSRDLAEDPATSVQLREMQAIKVHASTTDLRNAVCFDRPVRDFLRFRWRPCCKAEVGARKPASKGYGYLKVDELCK